MPPMITKPFSASIIHARNSRNRENGGLVTTISASSRSFRTSLLLKSPSHSRYSHSKSSKFIFPSPVLSFVRVYILPFESVLFLSYFGLLTSRRLSCIVSVYSLLSFAKLVLMSFLSPNLSKFWAKNFVKLLHSGSSQGRSMIFPRKTSGLYSIYAFISFSISEYCV